MYFCRIITNRNRRTKEFSERAELESESSVVQTNTATKAKRQANVQVESKLRSDNCIAAGSIPKEKFVVLFSIILHKNIHTKKKHYLKGHSTCYMYFMR